jgi:hypothetical protein
MVLFHVDGRNRPKAVTNAARTSAGAPPNDVDGRLTMKKHLICGFALALCCAPALFAQMAAEPKPAAAHDCAAMMEQHDAMQTHLAEMNAKLDTMVAEMNKAKGSAKVDKTAAVLTELVAQRAMMQKHMAEMQPKMMQHMMEHMRGGMMKGMSDSMSGCPMMRGMKGMQGMKGDPPAPQHQH